MADHVWIATTSTWTTAGNWTGGVPVSNGRALFGASTSQQAVTGLSQAGIDLDYLQVNAAFLGAIGASGTPLQIAADVVNFMGSGEFNYESHNNGASLKTDVMNIKAASGGVIVRIGSVSGAAGEVDKINIGRGNVTLTTVTGCDELNVGYVSNPASDVTLNVNSTCGTIARGSFKAGSIFNNAAMTAAYVSGTARFAHGSLSTSPGALSYLNASDSAYVQYDMAGTIALLVVGGNAVVDFTKTGFAKVVTELVLLDRAVVISDLNTTLPTGQLYHDLRDGH